MALKFYADEKTKLATIVRTGIGTETLEGLKELDAGVVDAAKEKHVPEVKVNGDTVEVCVGSVEHPMQDVHYIQFIYLETEKGGQVKYLAPGEAPKAEFKVTDDKTIAVYEYCNLHGLWKKEL